MDDTLQRKRASVYLSSYFHNGLVGPPERYEERFSFRSGCRAATRSEDKPDPCEVKQNKGTRKNKMTKLLKGEVHGVRSCYDDGDGGCRGDQMREVASAESMRMSLRKRIACMMTRLLFVALLCVVVGCKENYESPEAFIKHWVIDGEAKRYCSDERMKELHFKGIEVSNARISTKNGESTVFATLSFVPDSDKTVYAFKPGSWSTRNLGPFGPQKEQGLQILSKEELKESVTADLKMPRIKMDNGIFAPIDMDGNIKYIEGWGRIGSLMVVSEESITASLRKLLVEAKSLQDPNAKNASNKAMVIMRLASYASSGELDFIKDRKLLEELGEACMGILDLTKNEQTKLQLVRYFGEKTINAFTTLSEMLRARGVTVKMSKESCRIACISNMKQLVAAADLYLMGHSGVPTLADLCGPTKLLKEAPTCPKDNSSYTISLKNGDIKVTCGSGDPEHVLP